MGRTRKAVDVTPEGDVNSITEQETVSAPEAPEETMTETETTEEPTFSEENVEETEESTDSEESTEEEKLPPPDLDALDPGLAMAGKAMQAMAEIARQQYLKVYEILDAQGDPDKVLAAARNSSEDPAVQAKVQAAHELQQQIDAAIAEANEILRNSGAVDVLSDEDLTSKRAELDKHRTAFNDSVQYGEDHVVEGFTRLFDELPGSKRRRKASGGQTREYEMSTKIKPKIIAVTVNGTDVRNSNGDATFTALGQYLKREGKETVQIGDLHKAWIAASGKDSVDAIVDDVFFDHFVGDKKFSIKITPKETAAAE